MGVMHCNVFKIDRMHEMFGIVPDKSCKDCEHLIRHKYNRVFYKCECYGDTSSESSDWRQKWTACGLFDKEYKGTPIIKFSVKPPKEDIQCEGQISLFDGDFI